MHKPKIYLDTTIPNYVFNNHVPDKQEAAAKLFDLIRKHKFETFISGVLIKEISETKEVDLRNKLNNLIAGLNILEINKEVIALAEEYINKEIIPSDNRDDALHIACASVNEVDFLLSYNFEHIVKIKTIDRITAINLLLGYKTPRIIIPEEVLDV